MEKNDILLFYATLQKKKKWSTNVIGYFGNLEIYNCRDLTVKEILDFKSRGFMNNAHLKRVDPLVDFLIKGSKCSKFLKKVFPLAEDYDNLILRRSLEDIICTSTGKKIKSRVP